MGHIKLIFIFLITGSSILHAQVVEEPILLRVKDCDIQGTLTLPKSGKADKVVLIISDSGPTDRNGNQDLMFNNSLLMYAKSLAEHNIASVRYDKRGVAASRSNGFDQNKIRFPAYLSDAAQWLKMLNADARFDKVIVAGHGEGALLALAAVAHGAKADGYISIAGMGQTIDLALKDRLSSLPGNVRHAAYRIIDSLRIGRMTSAVPITLQNILSPTIQPYIVSLMNYNPQKMIKSLNIPILILQGDMDLQVKMEDAKMLFEYANQAKMTVIKGMNHLLKECNSMDNSVQFETFVDPSRPLVKQIVDESVNFINSL